MEPGEEKTSHSATQHKALMSKGPPQGKATQKQSPPYFSMSFCGPFSLPTQPMTPLNDDIPVSHWEGDRETCPCAPGSRVINHPRTEGFLGHRTLC